MKDSENIKGWISYLKNKFEFIGWLIDTNDISPRIAIIKIKISIFIRTRLGGTMA